MNRRSALRSARGWLLLPLLLTACSGPPIEPADASSNPVDPTVVTVQRSGGFAGIDERLTVRDDGTVTLDRTRPGGEQVRDTVSEQSLTRLRSQLRDVPWGDVPVRSVDSQLRDGFEYTVRYEQHTVTFTDGAAPEQLREVNDQLAEIFSAVSE